METYPRELIDAIARRHGLAGEPELLSGGTVNEAWRIGAHVLRIVRAPDCDDQLAREVLVAPLVEAAGVRSPRLVAADLACGLAPRPYTIHEHVPGVLLGHLPADPKDCALLFREVGHQIARIATIRVDAAMRPQLHERNYNPRRRLAIARDQAAIDAATADEIAAWLDANEPPPAPRADAFLHNDIHPWNLLVDPTTRALVAIIDWGDAGVGDPALDFTSMPLFAISPLVAGYREAGGSVDAGFVRRALWNGMALALWEIVGGDAAVFERRWWRMPTGGWPAIRASVS